MGAINLLSIMHLHRRQYWIVSCNDLLEIGIASNLVACLRA